MVIFQLKKKKKTLTKSRYCLFPNTKIVFSIFVTIYDEIRFHFKIMDKNQALGKTTYPSF